MGQTGSRARWRVKAKRGGSESGCYERLSAAPTPVPRGTRARTVPRGTRTRTVLRGTRTRTARRRPRRVVDWQRVARLTWREVRLGGVTLTRARGRGRGSRKKVSERRATI